MSTLGGHSSPLTTVAGRALQVGPGQVSSIPVRHGQVGAAQPTPAPTASISIVTPPPVDKTGVGGLGFLIVLALLLVSIGLFFAMRGSLQRLKRRELDGSFGGSPDAGP